MKIVDTNILLDYPQIIEEETDLEILTDVLKELDGLKMNQNSEVAFKARRAAVVLSRNLAKINWNTAYENEKIPVDDKLLSATGKNNILITNDVYLKVKAIIKGYSTKGYGSAETYTGIKYLDICSKNEDDINLVENIYNTGAVPAQIKFMNEGEYLIIQDSYKNPCEKELHSIYVMENEKLSLVNYNYKYRIENEWIENRKGINPRNPEQICLFNALNNSNKTIIYAGGPWGTGKSYLLNNFALQELEKDRIKKIVYVPNNSYTENTIDLGALPGEVLDKVIGQIGPLVDLVGIDKVQDMITHEQLEVVPMSYIRGRTFTDSIVLVNEAQNLTEDHIKLLLGRVGVGSRIFFDGDQKQCDSAIFRNKNGLKLLLNLRKSPIYSKIFSTITLNKIERSITAQAAAYLDEIMGNI